MFSGNFYLTTLVLNFLVEGQPRYYGTKCFTQYIPREQSVCSTQPNKPNKNLDSCKPCYLDIVINPAIFK